MTRRRPVWRRSALAAALAVALSAGSSPALTLLPLDLAQLTGGAERIFVGRVERVATGRDANGIPAVWTTFAIDEPLKGAGGLVTLKQLGTAFGDGAAPVVPHVGLPRYERGETILLFVHPESGLGFTSPVGLAQGCFRIRERDGQRLAENDLGNRNLTAPTTAAPTHGPAGDARTPLPFEALLARVRTLVGGAP